MRAAGVRWLPKEEAESEKSYKARLKQSFLYGAYNDTVTKLITKPFSRPVLIQGEKVPDKLASIELDVDQTGKNLTAFAQEVLESAIDYGMTHILVDHPTLPKDATLADEREAGARPTLVHVRPPALLGWKTAGMKEGFRLTEVRIKETREESKDTYGDDLVEYVRVIRENNWEVWKKSSGTGWAIESQGENGLGKVPLVTIYLNRKGLLEAVPALDDLAWLNIEHWQSRSAHRNILSFARFGILFGAGFSPDEVKAGLEIGPRRLVTSVNPDARLAYVEHSGAAIQAGERDERAIEQRMEVLGLQPFVQRQGVETATGKQIQDAKTLSTIQSWVRKCETGITDAYRLGAEWAGIKLPESFKVDIYTDFDLGILGSEEVRVLLDMALAGKLSDETFLEEVRRRGILKEGLDIKQELDKIADQPPPAPVGPAFGKGGSRQSAVPPTPPPSGPKT